MSKLKVLDLFSGIGGFSLGLERTGGFETVAFCEIEEFPRQVLAKHWPDVPIYEDVRNVTEGRLEKDGIAVDVVTGGFPCQDLSVAGSQGGINAERSGLWSELKRIISEVRPRYAIVENVTNLLSGPSEQRGMWFGRVLGDLAEIGYDAEWHCIPATYIGAKHHRDRIWIVAYPKQEQRVCTVQHGDNESEGSRGTKAIRLQDGVRLKMGTKMPSLSFGEWLDQPDPDRMADGVSDWSHRLAACGNAVVPQIPEMIGYAILEDERELAILALANNEDTV